MQKHHHGIYDITKGICDDSTFNFKESHAIDVLNGYSASTYLLGILKLNDEVLEWWNYVQPIIVQDLKSVFCAYWHKYYTDFGIGISIVKSVTYQKAYNNYISGDRAIVLFCLIANFHVEIYCEIWSCHCVWNSNSPLQMHKYKWYMYVYLLGIYGIYNNSGNLLS